MPVGALHDVDDRGEVRARQDRDHPGVAGQPRDQRVRGAGHRAVEVHHHQRGVERALAELVERQVGVDRAPRGLERDRELLPERLVRRDRDNPPSEHPAKS